MGLLKELNEFRAMPSHGIRDEIIGLCCGLYGYKIRERCDCVRCLEDRYLVVDVVSAPVFAQQPAGIRGHRHCSEQCAHQSPQEVLGGE